ITTPNWSLGRPPCESTTANAVTAKATHIASAIPTAVKIRASCSSDALRNSICHLPFEHEDWLKAPQHHGEGEVQNHDCDQARPHCAPGCQAHAHGTAGGEVAVEAVDQGHYCAEDRRLDQ